MNTVMQYFRFFCVCQCLLAGGVWAGTYSGGDGTSGNPYQISSVVNWQELIATSADWGTGQYFVLTGDIDFGGATITPVGTSSNYFTGVLDGNGHVLSHFVIDQPGSENVGLFGYVGSGGQIRNLGVENADIQGNGYVGGLCGYNSSGTISQSYATGSVTGSYGYVGGLCGYIDHGTLSECYATGSVTGSFCVGGLCGSNSGTINQCYATGSVTGRSSVGGLCGSNSGTIIASFWDIETSSQAGSFGGKGLTSAQMKTMSIFQNAGWALSGWVMQDGVDTPRLSWENTGGVSIPAAGPVPLAGSGTEADPYQVWTAGDFALLSWHTAVLDTHIVLKASLDLNGAALWPIGDLGPFTGVFDGEDHVIQNAVVDQSGSDYVGLFSYLGSGGRIRNLGVENADVRGRNYVGGLCGSNSGTISRSYATGSVTGTLYVGGLCGYNYYGTLSECYVAGSVTGSSIFVGGLCGYNYYGTLSECYATGSVTGNAPYAYVGGLVGYNEGVLAACYSKCSVSGTGSDSHFGGLAGSNSGTLTACYNTGQVSGTGEIGGLVGKNMGTLIACYNTGQVSGTGDVGGLVGLNWGSISTSYSVGLVSGTGNIGGFAGRNDYDTLTACFWDIYSSGQYQGVGYGAISGVKGKTTNELLSPSTFIDAGWDFIGESKNGLHSYWQSVNADYPRLTIHTWALPGQGTPLDPYIILKPEDLGKIWLKPSECYRLSANINLSGISWSSSVVPEFTGIMFGQGYVISNLTINQPNAIRVGLFGRITSGQIYNLGVNNVDISGYSSVGGLVGYIRLSNSLMRNCYTSGLVRGTDINVGGLVGYNQGLLISCYSICSVNGAKRIGGLVGFNWGSLSTCYAACSVNGTESVGGLVGYYSYPDGGSFSSCFWDVQTEGLTDGVGNLDPDPSGVTGKTTAEMKTQSTFTNAGWDFTESDGDAAEWWMPANDYPRLGWDTTFTAQKCTVKVGKSASADSVQIVGVLDATASVLEAALEIEVCLESADMAEKSYVFPVNASTFKKGKFSAKIAATSLKFDPKNGKMAFSVKNADLTGLACPLAVTVTIGGYAARFEADEALVNGSKPCPPQLLMGVCNSMQVNKAQVKLGKTAGTDSLSVSGYFTIAGDYNKLNPLVVTLGGQSFTVAGSQFSTKGYSESCTNATCQEGPLMKAKFDFAKCTFQIQVAKANFSESGPVDFGINCFGHTLPKGTITLPQ